MNIGGGEGGLGDNKELGGLFSMLGKLDSVKTEEDAEKLKNEMDSYLQNELGVDMNELNKKIENVQDDLIIKMNDESEDANLD